MNQINILVVEDEPIIALDLKRALLKMGYHVLETLDSGEDALSFIEETAVPDIILMDIQLEGDLDGVDTAHQISKHYPIPIIYLTSNTDSRTFNRAKLTQPHGFLSKPFRLNDIKHSIDLAFVDQSKSPEAIEQNQEETRTSQIKNCIFVKSTDHLVKINLSEILYVEADNCYCTIATTKANHVIVSTLKKFEKAIDYPSLMRVHRSFIVNLATIEKIGDGYVEINGKTISVGRSFKDQLLQRIPKY